MRTSNRRGFGIAVVLVSVVLLLMSLLAALSSQRSGDVRRRAAAALAGRIAEQYARSAIEESLASLTPDTLFGAGKMDAQGRFDSAFLSSLDSDGNVRKDAAGAPVSVTFPDSLKVEVKPETIQAMSASDKSSKVFDVVVRPLTFSARNYGVIRVEARARSAAGDTLTERTVIEERPVAFDPSSPGRLRIGQASLRTVVQRKSNEQVQS